MYSKTNPIRFTINCFRIPETKHARAGIAGILCALVLSFLAGLSTSQAAFSNETIFSAPEAVNYGLPAPAMVTVTAPTLSQTVGSQFDVLISVSDVTGYQLNAYDMVMTFDPAVITPMPNSGGFGCSTAGLTSTNGSFFSVTCNNSPAGTLAITGSNGGDPANDLTGSGAIVKVHFLVTGPVGSNSPLQFTSSSFYNEALQIVPSQSVAGNIHVIGTQTINALTPPPPSNANYGNTFTADATGGASGNPVTVTTSGSCTGGNGNPVPQTITMTSGTGVCSVMFDQAGNVNYSAAPQVTRTVNASPRPITVTADPQTKIYGQSDPAFSYQVTGLVGADTVSGALTRDPGQNVGQYAIRQGSLSAGPNYQITYNGDFLTITKRAITITVDPGQSKVYGTPDPVIHFTVTVGALQFGNTFTGSLGRPGGEAVGTYAVTLGTLTENDGNGGQNYDVTFNSNGFQITAAPLTATATASNKVYDGNTTASATCTLAGAIVPGDVVNCVVDSATFATPTVGTAKTVTANVSLSGAAAANYTVGTPVTTTADITPKALTAVASASNKVYDGNTTASATCSIPIGIVAGDTVNCVVSSASFATPGVGTGKTVTANVSITGASAGNYTIGTPVTTTANITPVALTAVASVSNKVYDGNATAAATCTIPTGIVAGDTVTCSVTSAAFATPSVGTAKTVTVNVSLGGASAANYTVGTPVTTTADITPKALTATASVSNKPYDGNATASATCALNPGVIAGDTVNCVVSSATFNNPAVGTAKPVTVNITLSGAAAGNYTVTTPISGSADITPKALTAVASASNKAYDGNTTASATCSIPTGIVAGDTVNCVVPSASFATPSVGIAKTVTVNVSITGASAGNYTVGTPVTTTADITPRALTITADPKTKIFGQADPPLTYQVTSGSLIAGDNLTGSLTRDPGENVGPYNINQGSVSAGANYAITYVTAVFNITQASQAITITTPAPASAVVNSTFNVAATGGGSGNPVAITGSGACAGSSGNSVGGSPVTITMVSGTGTCHITFDQAGNANFTAAPQLSSDTTAIDQATVQFASAAYIDDESQSAQIVITRGGDTTVSTTVQFATSVGGATPANAGTCGTSPADYQAVSTTVTFAPTVLQQTVPVVLCKDMLDEPLETVNLTISSPTNGVLGAQSTAVLNINDTANQFESTGLISFATGAPATPYPSTINVTGAPTVNGGMRVTLYDLTHASPGNIDILLVGPLGQKMIIMGDAGGSASIVNPTTLTFQDSAGIVLPHSTLIGTGKYEPTTWVAGQPDFAAPAPIGPYSEPGSVVGGTPSFASVFGTANPNGQWSLFVRDDGSPTFAPLTDQVAGGWGLQFNLPTAADVSLSGRVMFGERGVRNAMIRVTGDSLTTPITVLTGPNGSYVINGLRAGQTYVITAAARRFVFEEPTRVITLNDNAVGVDFSASLLR